MNKNKASVVDYAQRVCRWLAHCRRQAPDARLGRDAAVQQLKAMIQANPMLLTGDPPPAGPVAPVHAPPPAPAEPLPPPPAAVSSLQGQVGDMAAGEAKALTQTAGHTGAAQARRLPSLPHTPQF